MNTLPREICEIIGNTISLRLTCRHFYNIIPVPSKTNLLLLLASKGKETVERYVSEKIVPSPGPIYNLVSAYLEDNPNLSSVVGKKYISDIIDMWLINPSLVGKFDYMITRNFCKITLVLVEKICAVKDYSNYENFLETLPTNLHYLREFVYAILWLKNHGCGRSFDASIHVSSTLQKLLIKYVLEGNNLFADYSHITNDPKNELEIFITDLLIVHKSINNNVNLGMRNLHTFDIWSNPNMSVDFYISNGSPVFPCAGKIRSRDVYLHLCQMNMISPTFDRKQILYHLSLNYVYGELPSFALKKFFPCIVKYAHMAQNHRLLKLLESHNGEGFDKRTRFLRERGLI